MLSLHISDYSSIKSKDTSEEKDNLKEFLSSELEKQQLKEDEISTNEKNHNMLEPRPSRTSIYKDKAVVSKPLEDQKENVDERSTSNGDTNQGFSSSITKDLSDPILWGVINNDN
jgi:hypothetical protein